MTKPVELLPRKDHPNKLPFEGVLTLIETPSNKAPSGARGHRVMLDRAAAVEALDSLVDMAVDYKPGWGEHDSKHKIGVIKNAWIKGNEIHVSGFLYGKDFDYVVLEMRRITKPLGMSYELADAHVHDMNAEIWRLTQFIFTGAAILYCEKAAYTATSFCIAASAEDFDGRISFVDSCDITGSITPAERRKEPRA